MVQARASFPKAWAVIFSLTLALVFVPDSHANKRVFQRMLRSTGWVVMPQRGGRLSMGTCWVLDARRRLVVTNKHVVANHRRVKVYFPKYRRGKLVTASRAYYFKKSGRIAGRVLATDEMRDLALIKLKRLPRGIRALPLASQRPAEGEIVYSIGNSSVGGNVRTGRLWRFISGRVKDVIFTKTTLNNCGYTVESCVVRTTAPTHPGDSGGPVVNQYNQLVAVHDSTTTVGPPTAHHIDVSELKEFICNALQRRRPVASGGLTGGSWKAVTFQDGKYMGMSRFTFGTGGAVEWIGRAIWQGRYVTVDGSLRMEFDTPKSRWQGPITWVSGNRFSVTFGKVVYDFQRR
jgi:hypothetical protein